MAYADSSGFTPLQSASDLQSAESSSRVPEGLAEDQLNTQRAELSDYFAKRYLAGELYNGSGYSNSHVGELFTYKYKASDGVVMVWRHAFDLRAFGKQGEKVDVLYHYTDELAFHNVGNLEQTAAQLFASLKDDRARSGKGLYATQREPAVWGSRLQILLNNYSRGDPECPDPSEKGKVEKDWGTGRESGHRAAFCIPLIVPRSIAYHTGERLTPDLAKRTVKDSAGQERPIKPGEDYKGRPGHPNRDEWVIQVEIDGELQHAVADADSILDLLHLRVWKRLDSVGEDMSTAACMYELARRLDGRARYGEAEEWYRECLRIRMAKLGDDHPHTQNCRNNMAFVFKAQGRLVEAEALFRKALEKSKAIRGEDHPDTLQFFNNLALVLHDQGRLVEAEALYRKVLEKIDGARATFLAAPSFTKSLIPFHFETWLAGRLKLGNQHPDTMNSIYNLADLLKSMKKFEEAEELFREHLAARMAVHGEHHKKTLDSRRNLARFLKERG